MANPICSKHSRDQDVTLDAATTVTKNKRQKLDDKTTEALAKLQFREKFALSDDDSIFEKSPTPSSMSDFSKIESAPKSSNFSTKASFAKASTTLSQAKLAIASQSTSSVISNSSASAHSQAQIAPQLTLTDKTVQALSKESATPQKESPLISAAFGDVKEFSNLPPELQNLCIEYLSNDEVVQFIREFMSTSSSKASEDQINFINCLLQNKTYRTKRLKPLQEKLAQRKDKELALPQLPQKKGTIHDIASFLQVLQLNNSVKKHVSSLNNEAALTTYLKSDFHTEEESLLARMAACVLLDDTNRLKGYFRQSNPDARLDIIDSLTAFFGTQKEDFLIDCAFTTTRELYNPALLVPEISEEQVATLKDDCINFYNTFCFSSRYVGEYFWYDDMDYSEENRQKQITDLTKLLDAVITFKYSWIDAHQTMTPFYKAARNAFYYRIHLMLNKIEEFKKQNGKSLEEVATSGDERYQTQAQANHLKSDIWPMRKWLNLALSLVHPGICSIVKSILEDHCRDFVFPKSSPFFWTLYSDISIQLCSLESSLATQGAQSFTGIKPHTVVTWARSVLEQPWAKSTLFQDFPDYVKGMTSQGQPLPARQIVRILVSHRLLA